MKDMQEKRKSAKVHLVLPLADGQLRQMQETRAYVEQLLAVKAESPEEYEVSQIAIKIDLQLQLQADELTEADFLKQQNDVKVYFQKLEGIEEKKEEKVHDFSLIDMDVENLSMRAQALYSALD